MSEHTPLPWRLADYGPMSGDVIRFEIYSGDAHICDIDPDVEGAPEAEANATYIVRACNAYPKLVAAMKAVIARFGHAEQQEHDELSWDQFVVNGALLLITWAANRTQFPDHGINDPWGYLNKFLEALRPEFEAHLLRLSVEGSLIDKTGKIIPTCHEVHGEEAFEKLVATCKQALTPEYLYGQAKVEFEKLRAEVASLKWQVERLPQRKEEIGDDNDHE